MNFFQQISNLTSITPNNGHHNKNIVLTRVVNDDMDKELRLFSIISLVSKNESFFLDFQLFCMSFSSDIYTLLELTRPGPSAEVDFYYLYCRHLQGDKHILRTIQNLCKYCPKQSEVQEMILKAVNLAPRLKAQKKLLMFYQLHGLNNALHEPFISPESMFRLVLTNLWKFEGRGKVTRKKMCRLYISYCQHILKLRDFFYSIFELSYIFPHGPYKIEDLEYLLIMVKNVGTDRFLSGSDVFNLAQYLRDCVGIDHDIFLQLPNVVRYVTTSEPVKLVIVPPEQQQRETNRGEESSSSQKEYFELCAVAPSSAKNPLDRVQVQLPSDLTNLAYAKIFSWTFLPSCKEAGVFFIKNCQWEEYLVLDDEHEVMPGLYSISMAKDYKNRKCKFTLVLRDESIQIVSCTGSPIVIDEVTQVAYVKKNLEQKLYDNNFLVVKPFLNLSL